MTKPPLSHPDGPAIAPQTLAEGLDRRTGNAQSASLICPSGHQPCVEAGTAARHPPLAAGVGITNPDLRLILANGLRRLGSRCPKCAVSGLMHRSNSVSIHGWVSAALQWQPISRPAESRHACPEIMLVTERISALRARVEREAQRHSARRKAEPPRARGVGADAAPRATPRLPLPRCQGRPR